LPQAATLLAQQAQAAGVTIRVQQENPSIYYTPPGGLFSFPFRSNYYVPLASLDAYYYEYMVGSAPLQETGWGQHGGYQAQIDKLTNEARGELDPKRAQQLWHEVQQAQFTSGGLLVWANTAFVHLSAKHVKGLSETPAGYLNNGRFYDAWMAKQ
jgi:ABC-type transport system substrate-binding protein